MIYPEVRSFFDRIADICEPDWARYQAPELTYPNRRPNTKVAAKRSDDDVDGAAIEQTLLRVAPNLKAEEVSDARAKFLALRDRENFRQQKLSGGKAVQGSSRAVKEH